ncbi:MFS transporter [Silvimonas sp.]|uniref:MFS transporter n=1 Tax=Silvimonas sp. TaxID=2650811 RepID=UPI00283BC945|nr:MFS transporter [Silvimonas sp.]MDR3429471.1 MFS transporter [Silvimonas sp.]
MDSSLLALKPYRHFLVSRLGSFLAYQMLAVAVGWQMYDLTHSALNLGFIGIAQFLPQLLLTLVVGHVADRYDRRRIVTICQIVEGTAAIALAVGSFYHLLTPLALYMGAFCIGAGRAFESPSLQALVPNLVTEKDLPRALALNSGVMQMAIISGPALGGFIYAVGPDAVYTVSAVCWLIAALAIGTLPLLRQVQRTQPPASLEFLFAGIRYIREKKVILGAISLDLFAVLLGGATALLPIYARDILHTGPWGMGVLRSAPAVGALSMSIYLAHYPLKQRVGKIMFGAVGVFGLATIVFGLSSNFFVSLVALAFLGASDMISVVVRSSLVQLETPDAMRGRVSAVSSIFIGASNQLGEFESGVTAALLGPVPAVVLGGIGTLVVVGLWMRWFPQLTQRETLVSAT